MSRPTQIVRWLYRRSLRLYPSEFRAAFGDEMLVVFTRALDEAAAQGGGVLVRFCLREVGALSSSVVREQVAYRARHLVPVQEGFVMQSPERGLSYRFSVTVILSLIAAFCLLIVTPFFGLGLHLEPAYAIANGGYDPKGYPFFQTGFGNVARLLGMIAVLATPLGVVAFGAWLAFMARRNWRTWSTARRWLAVITLAVGVGLFAFLVSDVGRVVISWYLD